MKNVIITGLLIYLMSPANAQESETRTGEFSTTSTILQLMGEAGARTFADKIPVNEVIEWEVYVPEEYNHANPAGALVFINSRNSGKIQDAWKGIMEKHNLIWIGANESGNDISIARRVAFAILAPQVVNKNYSLDPDRVYISGFSGGSRVASMVATEYNNLFKGAVYNSGANYWGEAAQARYKEMLDNYYVFITGSEDFNLEDTREVHSAYKTSGIGNSKLIVIPGMAHERPDADNLDTAIQYLDSRRPNKIPKPVDY